MNTPGWLGPEHPLPLLEQEHTTRLEQDHTTRLEEQEHNTPPAGQEPPPSRAGQNTPLDWDEHPLDWDEHPEWVFVPITRGKKDFRAKDQKNVELGPHSRTCNFRV